jgi:hypothetical protein
MVVIKHRGSFNNLDRFLSGASKLDIKRILESYGQRGVSALASATPVESGLTAGSWGYEVRVSGSSYILSWTNSNVNKGVPIAIILQYGHGTGTGGFVEGRDYINPALLPIFDQIAEEAWQEVKRL